MTIWGRRSLPKNAAGQCQSTPPQSPLGLPPTSFLRRRGKNGPLPVRSSWAIPHIAVSHSTYSSNPKSINRSKLPGAIKAVKAREGQTQPHPLPPGLVSNRSRPGLPAPWVGHCDGRREPHIPGHTANTCD